ncbi:MAG: FAD-dependent oxidoreductase [Tissierellia bacterium]|nr:FAD-dependent oxidoreductase [Tissierellia bacterium]
MKEYDLIIVGGGPAGLSSAIYAGRALLKTLVIEAFSLGGRINDTAKVINYPAASSNRGQALVQDFRDHASFFKTNEFIYGTVTKVEKDGDYFIVSTKRNKFFKSKAVIVATGTVSKVLNIPGEIQLKGNGVSYCATCDGDYFRNSNIHVLGSGDVALEEADYLAQFANHITMVVLHEEGKVDGNYLQFQKILYHPKIEFLWNSKITAIEGKDQVEGIEIENTITKKRKKVHSDGVFIFGGMEPQANCVKEILTLDEDGYVITDDRMATDIPGLFCAGDLRQKTLRQIVTAASDGAIATVYAEKYIRNEWRQNESLSNGDGKI